MIRKDDDMATNSEYGCSCSRRDFMTRSAAAIGAGVILPMFLRETDVAMAANAVAGSLQAHPERILVVLELSGGNDGLNTVIPYTNDDYYRARPTLAIQPNNVRKVSDEFGFHNNLPGWERLFKDGNMAVVHGCSYPNPNRSHFESMKFWHTGVPNAPETRGWLGRFADTYQPEPISSYMINVAKEQSAAVGANIHSPVVFDDPERFGRQGSAEEREIFAELSRKRNSEWNPSLEFVRGIASTAESSSEFIRHSCAEYKTKADYGYGDVGLDLKKIVALIGANSPARIFYTNFGSFDTHVSQASAHTGLFNQAGDAVHAFINDLNRIGRADDVSLLIFTEFGRRVQENASKGTDHGVASPMFIVGNDVKGGFYGDHPSLTDLDEGDLKMTTDFRSVYATMTKEWMGFEDTQSILRQDFETLGAFRST